MIETEAPNAPPPSSALLSLFLMRLSELSGQPLGATRLHRASGCSADVQRSLPVLFLAYFEVLRAHPARLNYTASTELQSTSLKFILLIILIMEIETENL